ncbi:MAG: hypothetical protein NT076_03200 [Candidatus Pacearchaeota archaeon]|nr:hypothetical protein [Candidatus Pacearchaeota archaeon]
MENCGEYEGNGKERLLEKIRELYQQGYNDGNIADLLGMNIWNISRIRRKIGLPRNLLNNEMTREKRRRTMKASLRTDTGERMNYRTMAHELNAMRLGWPDYKLGEALILRTLETEAPIPMTSSEILARVNTEKEERDWKPEMTRSMFFHYAARLKRQGLMRRFYPTGKDWRKQPRIYDLTEKAYDAARNLRGKLCDFQ